jgi:hypothetical protein
MCGAADGRNAFVEGHVRICRLPSEKRGHRGGEYGWPGSRGQAR